MFHSMSQKCFFLIGRCSVLFLGAYYTTRMNAEFRTPFTECRNGCGKRIAGWKHGLSHEAGNVHRKTKTYSKTDPHGTGSKNSAQ